MCLIIKKPAGRRICPHFITNAWKHNAHGWGSCRIAGGQVMVARGLTLEDLIEHNAALPPQAEVYLHLRRATYGAVNQDMAHPHEVRSGLLLMHNGSIARLAPTDPSYSDTFELARLLHDMLGGLCEAQVATLIRSQGFATLLTPMLEGSMVVLIDAHGAVRLGRPWHTIERAQWDASMTGIEVSNLHTWGRASASAAPAQAAWHDALVAGMA